MTMALRVLVCDDELIARRRASRLLSEQADVEVVAECASGDEVLAKLAAEDIDLVVLDINMPGMSGIETVMRMPEDRPYLIFLTAHPEHAVSAFDLGATDYLMKPVDEARLKKALDRARRQLDAPARHDAHEHSAPLARLAITTKAGVVLLGPDEVTHAVFDGQLVTVHTRDRAILCDATLQELEDRLSASHFERVHRRAIVNLLHVERLEPVMSGGYVARVAGGKRVDVSRQAARKLRRRLGIA
ncbi:MAG TPA: LytTR family DNA-binding domain-containing protein [Kofleriaceae bacterium]|jgi:two-component system LytT family response regulator|nr:LytTR family DNA-binding domain-containing protein [Kofleriaceae bacterium]